MGLILDSSVLIAEERGARSIAGLLQALRDTFGDSDLAVSVITASELYHGVARAKTEIHRATRQQFADEACQLLQVYPVTLDIAKKAGQLDGELTSMGISIGFADLIIGVTALHLRFDLVTLNERHFRHVPGLNIKDFRPVR